MSRFNKLERFKQNKSFKHFFEVGYYDVRDKDFELKGTWNEKFFKNTNNIVLELGCGKGEYSCQLSQKYPDKNFIGVDIKGARMWIGARKSLETNIPNIAFLRTRVEFTPKCFAKNEVSEIWITFPDPQLGPKKRIKKRLTSSRFLNYYRNFCVDNALINLKTDDETLYNYTKRVLDHNGIKPITDYDDLYNSGIEDDILSIKTFYENIWLEEGKKIKYLQFQLPQNREIIEPEHEDEK